MVEKLPFLSDEHHFAIAAVAVRSSQMEHQIEYMVFNLFASTERTAEFLLKNTSTDRLVDLLSAALTDNYPDEESNVAALIAEIKRLRTERNEIMHWIWGKTSNPESALHVSMRPTRSMQAKTKAASEIQKVANDMLGVTTSLRTRMVERFDRAFR